jgi:hypothetical protein
MAKCPDLPLAAVCSLRSWRLLCDLSVPPKLMVHRSAKSRTGMLVLLTVLRNAIVKRLPMKLRSFSIKLAIAAALMLTAPWIFAQDGLQSALSRANLASPGSLEAPFGQTVAVADFDGDSKLDGAVLVGPGWPRPQSRLRTIELHFTGRRNTDLTFESNESTLAITALDVNRDGATDIVVEQPFTHKRLHVWLNDGRGGFRKVGSEDFPSADLGNQHRLETPAQELNCPALSLPPQRGFEVAISTVLGSTPPAPSCRKEALLIALAAGRHAAAPNSPRAPPLSRSL